MYVYVNLCMFVHVFMHAYIHRQIAHTHFNTHIHDDMTYVGTGIRGLQPKLHSRHSLGRTGKTCRNLVHPPGSLSVDTGFLSAYAHAPRTNRCPPALTSQEWVGWD